MIKLKILLHSNYLYLILFFILIVYCLYFYNTAHTNITLNDKEYIGTITNYKIDRLLLTLELKGNQKVVGYYYFKNEIEKNKFLYDYKLGNKVLVSGEFSYPKNNTIPNLFNYNNYLKSKNIYMTINISNIKKISNNSSLFYKIRNSINNHISKYKSKEYLKAYILGDKNDIDKDILSSYQANGISHLLAISGMHISLLSLFILFILKNNKYKELITSIFLIFYMFLTGLSPSTCRSVLLFVYIFLNKKLELNISTVKLLILIFILLMFINPYSIYNIGFIYSFTICFYLLLFKEKLNDNNYLKRIFKVSMFAFFISLPITLYYFYEINFLSIILNIIFVPLVSIIIFPLALFTFFIPILDEVFLFFINILETLSNYFNDVNYFKITFGKVNYIFIILYYLFISLFLYFGKRKYLFLILLLLLIQYNKNSIFPSNYVIALDVGQGDSILLHSKKDVLIDTGGKVNFDNEASEIVSKKTIPLLNSLGIRKLDYLILTHGDFDHMGEAINLVNNFKVEKVIFNCGSYNDLESELIKVLNKKNIKYYSCIKELKIDNNKLYFLQTKKYDNENDNSNVIYTELNGYKFMFMGDASTTTENEILDKYNLPDIDVLKVGHHGSRTSSGRELIDEINPRYSIISVGKNNRYGHPNKEVLNNLKNSKIYRTDQDGSIMFKIENDKLKIETCSP